MRRRHSDEAIYRPSSAEQYPPRDPGLYLAVAKERLDSQMAFVDALDSKIGLLVSVASGLLGILAAVFALRSVQAESTASAPEIVTLVLAGCAYLVAASSGLGAYFLRSWKTGPPLPQTWDLMWGSDGDQLVGWKLGNIYRLSYEQNQANHRRKSNAVRVLFIAVVIQSLLAALALALVAAGV